MCLNAFVQLEGKMGLGISFAPGQAETEEAVRKPPLIASFVHTWEEPLWESVKVTDEQERGVYSCLSSKYYHSGTDVKVTLLPAPGW